MDISFESVNTINVVIIFKLLNLPKRTKNLSFINIKYGLQVYNVYYTN